MMERRLGRSPLRVSQGGLGTWPLAGNDGLPGYGRCDRDLALATLRSALEAGVTFIDTAPVYGGGLAERMIGQVLQRFPSPVVVCTKGGWDPSTSTFDPDPRKLERQVHESLERLQRDVLDVYLLHNVPARLMGVRELYQPLVALREKGRIGHIGVSVVHARDAMLAIDRSEIEVVELPYNFIHPEAEDVLPGLASAGKGVVVREALANGLLAGRHGPATRFAPDDFRSTIPSEVRAWIDSEMRAFEPYRRTGEEWIDFALRFVLDRPEVSTVLVGARTPEHVKAFGRAGEIAASAFAGSAESWN